MTKRWYIVHAYSNFENKVAESIRDQAKARGLSHLFEQEVGQGGVLVPMEKVVEVRRGRKVDADRSHAVVLQLVAQITGAAGEVEHT